MRIPLVLLAAMLAAPNPASAAPHLLRADQDGTYAFGGRCTAPDTVRLVLSGDRVEILQGAGRRVLFIESFCALNCEIEPPTDPRTEFSASLVRRPEDRGKVSNPFDETALNINAGGRPGIVTLTNGAPGTYQGRSRSPLRPLYGRPFTRCPG